MKNKKWIIVASICAVILLTTSILCSVQYGKANQELKTVQNELQVVQKNLQTETEKSEKLSVELDNTKQALNEANGTITDLKSSEYKLVYLGSFKITHYCTEKRAHICGGGNGITATGTKVTAGRTIAVDPKVIPYGTQVYIEGYGFRTVEDCGGAVGGNHIDVAVTSHSEATSLGTRNKGVWILVKKS